MFIHIHNVRIPMSKTDLAFQCLAYEVDLYEEKWTRAKERRKDDPIVDEPMPLEYREGGHNPYREIFSLPREIERLRRQHGDKLFATVYGGIAGFKRIFMQHVRNDNPWLAAQKHAVESAAAKEKARAAVETASLVQHAASEMVRVASGQTASVAPEVPAQPDASEAAPAMSASDDAELDEMERELSDALGQGKDERLSIPLDGDETDELLQEIGATKSSAPAHPGNSRKPTAKNKGR